jgi:hypothetical protein
MNVLVMYSIADLALARIARFLPNPLVMRLQRGISRHALNRLRVPAQWLAEGPDGFQAEDEIDLVFGFGNPNPDRTGCGSEVELIELANRRRSISDPAYVHIGNCSPCYRRLRALQRLERR